MNFEEFCEYVKENILDFMPEEYQDAEVKIDEIHKNNDVTLTTLQITKPDSNMCPNIYLNKYFDMYWDGAHLDEIMEKIANLRVAAHKTSVQISKIQDYEEIRHLIFPKIIGKTEWNLDYLEGKPYTTLDDLAVVFYIDVSEIMDMNGEDGRSSVVITDTLVKSWDKGKGDLLFQSIDNIRKSELFKPDFKGMSTVLGELTSLIPGYDEEEEREELMYVLSNKSKMNGASVILGYDTLRDIHAKIGDFVMIPSSIHEWIIIRKEKAEDLAELTSMIQEVNSSCVETVDRLSDHPYTFDGKEMHSCE